MCKQPSLYDHLSLTSYSPSLFLSIWIELHLTMRSVSVCEWHGIEWRKWYQSTAVNKREFLIHSDSVRCVKNIKFAFSLTTMVMRLSGIQNKIVMLAFHWIEEAGRNKLCWSTSPFSFWKTCWFQIYLSIMNLWVSKFINLKRGFLGSFEWQKQLQYQ